ncbi:MAG: hypothetical protein GQ574_23615 [Crocinitomix sp.]|nr:hypothetical protein [Crocinitomix sp.]
MRQDLNYIKKIVGLSLKGILLVYFASFFLGKNVVINLLSFEKSDYELYEEMETEDSEEENEVDDKEKEDKLKVAADLLAQSEELNFLIVEAWNSALHYEGFQREIPDPPPQV